MKVKIVMTGPGGELDSVVLNNIIDETDLEISEAVTNMVLNLTWAVGDTLSIIEIE